MFVVDDGFRGDPSTRHPQSHGIRKWGKRMGIEIDFPSPFDLLLLLHSSGRNAVPGENEKRRNSSVTSGRRGTTGQGASGALVSRHARNLQKWKQYQSSTRALHHEKDTVPIQVRTGHQGQATDTSTTSMDTMN
ncbi:hypothetical protein GE21DRAFT_2178 [Neurospora crassa]|uniref:Uncharacterized protein n=1 Tax=Neurospora crassa (strain ATCC 24698 / 74-OR23-1A / CBS 708.71 / DSM 1257 / FGSC 987) TaxID=367110 RepID=Q7SF92_NEUCR|nr:hypothetical protein NCU00557 [Neurospora crassa OR74A]EAA35482.1 hypothetical protein NCU00557 [Neurospora crassa OR74A]KHE85146.1 hypothetical protein GE21DRAFT_2178 [Neurospora crassa]|eukprot:XP_964718.1 hypothetical protein NCU00557 [Neurospora crassa OR74A]